MILRGRTEPAAGEEPGLPIVVAHGLTAHRDLTVHGSHALPRAGHRLTLYDARGHGASEGGASGNHDYSTLAGDLEAVIASQTSADGSRPILAGHSMGAHTIVALALRDPGAYAGLVLIGPASTGVPVPEEVLAEWDELAEGIEQGGVEGFLAAYEAHGLHPQWRETLLRITRARLGEHEHLNTLARALREVPRSLPFEGIGELEHLDLPALVVASHDEADPGHPYSVAAAYAEAIPAGRLLSESVGESPLAWQGGRLSREIAAFAAEDAVIQRG